MAGELTVRVSSGSWHVIEPNIGSEEPRLGDARLQQLLDGREGCEGIEFELGGDGASGEQFELEFACRDPEKAIDLSGFTVASSATHVELLRRGAPHKVAVYHSTVRATAEEPRAQEFDASTTLPHPLRCAAVLIRFTGKHAQRRVRVLRAHIVWSAASAAPSVGSGGAAGTAASAPQLGPAVGGMGAGPLSGAHASPAIMALLGAMQSSARGATGSSPAPPTTPQPAPQANTGQESVATGDKDAQVAPDPQEDAPNVSAPGTRSLPPGEAAARRGFDLLCRRMEVMEARLMERMDGLEQRLARMESERAAPGRWANADDEGLSAAIPGPRDELLRRGLPIDPKRD